MKNYVLLSWFVYLVKSGFIARMLKLLFHDSEAHQLGIWVKGSDFVAIWVLLIKYLALILD